MPFLKTSVLHKLITLMSLLTDNFDVGVATVAEDQLFRMLSFAFINKFNAAMPPMMRLFDQIGSTIDNPMRRLQYAETGVVVSFINNRGFAAELEFLTKFPGDHGFTNVIIQWSNALSNRPRVQYCWKGLVGVTNHRARVGRSFWLIPQELMGPIYKLAETTGYRPY